MNAAAREVEAILLVSGRPVPARVLAAATGRTAEEVEGAASILEERYSPDRSGIVLRRAGGGFQLATNPESSVVVERFRKEARPSPLSGAAHEVLACVLYLGPMTRGAVSKVRGVNSDAVARSLIERGLLAETGFEAETPGTPALLDLTEEFHIASGSSSRADFPPLDSLVSEDELDRVRERIVAPGPPDNPAPNESSPDETASGEAASGDSSPETPSSSEAAQDEPPPDDIASEGVAADETASGEPVSGDSLPEASAPDGIASGGTPTGGTAFEDAASDDGPPDETAPGKSGS